MSKIYLLLIQWVVFKKTNSWKSKFRALLRKLVILVVEKPGFDCNNHPCCLLPPLASIRSSLPGGFQSPEALAQVT